MGPSERVGSSLHGLQVWGDHGLRPAASRMLQNLRWLHTLLPDRFAERADRNVCPELVRHLKQSIMVLARL